MTFKWLKSCCETASIVIDARILRQLPLLVTATVVLGVTAHAREREWIGYENENFIAYSNAAPAKVLAHLVELEQIRGAALQIITIKVPADMPKTKVLLFRTKKEFTKASPVPNAAAFVMAFDGQPILAMSLAGDRDWSNAIIRHELVHVLLRSTTFEYPTWYEEGFAELASSMRIVDGGEFFILGEPTVRASYGGPLIFDWDELVSDRFDTHSIGSLNLGSSAYLQAWLLTHYVVLGEEFRIEKNLNRYLELMHGGATSTDAFESAFGMSAKELWHNKLRHYAREAQAYQIKLLQDNVDVNFLQSTADMHVVVPLLEFLNFFAIASKSSKTPDDPLGVMAGEWGLVRPTGHCEDRVQIAVDRQAGTATIVQPEVTNDGVRLPSVFSNATDVKSKFVLRAIEGYHEWRLSVRTPEFICISDSGFNENRCGQLLRKCGS